ncbi:molybdenum cofactor cytidylyltransferase [Tenacibaculum sp. MAR_2009_124]|uniref:nucleotidyltransferase family protein n=1 Tax=Tenacibaculum sp. MAR_2009_124 TaxID=1250059 RepID=UPI00089894C8|nr:nucleotidyltransferase family protein [Tenacibaculum sp. MAR_2009_124]SED17707.1 molybdenum cofactor cytidylyltransferase [Tenacibaculum sp. MAR_2009_124]
MKTAIVILAAGKSSRMGTAKQLLPYRHTTLLGWTIEQALKIVNTEVICITGAKREIVEKSISTYPITIIHNSNFQNGLSASIKVGIRYVSQKDFDNVLIILADQPFVTNGYLKEIISKSCMDPEKIIASNYGNRIGVPALFPRRFYQHLSKLTGDKGAKELLSKHSDNILKMPKVNLIDIDTQEEYEHYVRKH